VALLLPSTPEYPVAYLAAAKAGLVTSGINPRLGPREIGFILERSGARALVSEDGLRALSPAIPGRAEPSEDPVVAIVWTSGTTGHPKGAMYRESALDAIARIEAALDPRPSGRTLSGVPLAHMAFMTKIAATIDRHTCTVFPTGAWSASDALDLIERERITHMGGIPTQLVLMLREPDLAARDLSSVRECIVGGAPVSPELVAEIRESLGVPVVVRYSCTEVGLCCATRPGDPDEVVAHTVGRPLPEVEVRIGDGGEILVRSPAMFAGYWDEEDSGIDPEGFFHTGDVGELREDGNLRLLGRAKDVYIRGGYNVYPAEVEGVLLEHPKVKLAAVLGVPDEVLGERSLALVVAEDPSDPPGEEELRAFVAARIADYKAPDRVEVRSELPLTPMFKVDKAALREDLPRE
ncbi:MAG: class I adenylate-forming enzyme family protein, partial [Actinomycetota bacterium]